MSGAAIATKKPNTSEQLTFPAVFQEVYDLPLQYAPSARGPMMTPYEGDDFQAKYHEQKKKDADYMARAKVNATINHRHKYVVSPHGYFGLPPVELSQRKFANPSGGALSIYSARQDGSVDAPFEMTESGLSGGVLRTAEGQGYAKARLQARIRQLDAIAAAKQSFETGDTLKPSGPAATALPTGGPVTETTKTELQFILQSIIDALYGAQSGELEEGVEGEEEEIEGKDSYEVVAKIVFTDAVRALSIIIRTASAPETTAEDLEDIIEPVDEIIRLLLGITDPDYVEQLGKGQLAAERLTTTHQLFQKIKEYLTKMTEGINLSPKERVALSKALVRTLGFAKFAKDMTERKVSERSALELTARSRLFDARARQAFDDEDDDDDEDNFNRPAPRREDTEQGTNAATFDTSERDVFGYNSGEFLAYPTEGRPQRAAFIGEEMGPTATAAVEEEFKTDEETGRRDYGRPTAAASSALGLTTADVRRLREMEPFRRSASAETQRTSASAATARGRRSAMASPQLAPIVEAARRGGPRSVSTLPSTSTRSTRRSRREPPPRPPRISIPPPTSRSTTSTRTTAPTRSTRSSVPAAPPSRQVNYRAQINALESINDARDFANRISQMRPIPTANGKVVRVQNRVGTKLEHIKRNLRRRLGV